MLVDFGGLHQSPSKILSSSHLRKDQIVPGS